MPVRLTYLHRRRREWGGSLRDHYKRTACREGQTLAKKAECRWNRYL